MDGVLEGAAVLSACKLAYSLLFLPSLAASHSPVSFCCCLLLIFTDFLVTAFLGFFCILKLWLTELKPSGDIIALRFLLFLSHTYGAVLLLTAFLIAMETLLRVLWPHVAADPGTADGDGEEREHHSVSDEEEESLPQVVGFLCCLSAWIAVAFSVRWRWKLEEGWTAACMVSTDSLVRCLPSLLSPMHSLMNPYWIMAFLFLLTISTGLQRRNQTSAEPTGTRQHQDGQWQVLDRAMPAASMPVHSETSGSKCVDRDFALISHDCLSEKSGRQELRRTQGYVLLDLIGGQRLDSGQTSLSRWQLWGFPSLEENPMIRFVSVLSIFLLPLYFSVNVHLIRTVDTLLQGCIESLLSSVAKCRDRSDSHRVTQV